MNSIRSSLGKDRGVSPVISTILMVSVVVVIAASIGLTAMDTLSGMSDSAPHVRFDVVETDTNVKITHIGGESIDGDEIRLAGAAVNKKVPEWEGETVSAGDSATVQTDEGELQIVYEGESGDSSYLLTSAKVPDTIVRYVISQVRDGGQWDDSVDISMGEVTNTKNGNVYLEYTTSGMGKIVETDDTVYFNKPGSPSHGYYETHSFAMYETADKNNKLCSFSVTRSCWSCTTTWDSRCG